MMKTTKLLFSFAILVLICATISVTDSQSTQTDKSIGLFCTNWNTNVTSVCKTITRAYNLFSIFRPGKYTLRQCDFLRLTPHCCGQLCIPAKAGTCEESTGACRCSGVGKPELCNTFFEDSPGVKKAVIEKCRLKCNQGQEGAGSSNCKIPAYNTDSVNYVCVCYCDGNEDFGESDNLIKRNT